MGLSRNRESKGGKGKIYSRLKIFRENNNNKRNLVISEYVDFTEKIAHREKCMLHAVTIFLFLQKFRETNGFTKEITKQLI